MLNVGRLNEGVVLDHIKAGKCMTIYKDLKLDKLDCCVASSKMPEAKKWQKRHHQSGMSYRHPEP